MAELKGFGDDFKSAEEILRLTRFTVDNVADAVYWMDSMARFVFVNDTACSTLGYTREELLNLTVFDIDPAFTADIWKNAWEALKSRGKITLETVHRTKDGRIIPVEIMANYLSFGGRELDCAFARDITERKQAIEKILHRASLLKGINRVLQAALTSENEEDLGRTCLSIAEDVTGSRFGFIGEIGTDGLLHDTAVSDTDWKLCTLYDKTGHRSAPGGFRVHGIYGRVLLDGKGFFTNDPASHPDIRRLKRFLACP
jgi:PAS domain S-box-containing protein